MTDAQPTGRAYLKLLALGLVIGIPAALLAAGFLALVHTVEDWLWDDPAPWYLVLGLPTLGAAVVILARRLLPGDGGHPPLQGIGGGITPVSHGPGVALAAFGTLCFGAILGPEAPLIALGSVAGLAVTRFTALGEREQMVVGTAGSFSAISALFGGPLVAGMLLVEGGLSSGAALVPALLPGLVAAAVGYLLFVGLGDWGGLSSTTLSVPDLPTYEHTRVVEVLIGAGIGLVTALVIALVRDIAGRIERDGTPRLGMPPLLLLGGLATGALALLADALGADSQDVLFSGQTAIPDLVKEGSAGIVLVLLATKALGYAVCLGCGFRGGPVFPAIFIGIAIATLAVIGLDISPTLAVACGTAAGMAAMTRLVFSALLFASLLVGLRGLDAIPAAVFAATAAWVTMAALDARRGASPVPGDDSAPA
jgi:H+/Cl- antiporter ClcA